MLVGSTEYGTYSNGASVYKDRKGYYFVDYDPVSRKEYKHYLQNWRPVARTQKLALVNGTWNPVPIARPRAEQQVSNKYMTRPSPPYPANDFCEKKKKGNDGHMYISKPNKNGICRWVKV
jgi:hypothetical protein